MAKNASKANQGVRSDIFDSSTFTPDAVNRTGENYELKDDVIDEQQKGIPSTASTTQGDLSNDHLLDEYMAPYLSAYPDQIVFFLTSDGQVFLSSSESDARNHQRRLDHSHDLIEYYRG